MDTVVIDKTIEIMSNRILSIIEGKGFRTSIKQGILMLTYLTSYVILAKDVNMSNDVIKGIM